MLYSAVRDDPDGYVPLLSRAWADKSAECLCCDKLLRLVTRRRGGSYSLAVWPHGGYAHQAWCAFHRLDPELSGQSAYTDAAIRRGEDGTTTIRFAAPLVSSPVQAASTPSTASSEPGVNRSRLGLLALLHFLWEEAALNAWHGGTRRRPWQEVVSALGEQLADCVINNQPAAEFLYLVHRRSSIGDFDRYLSRLRSDKARLRRGFVLGELKQTHLARDGGRTRPGAGRLYRYELEHQRARQIFIRESLHERLQSSYRHAFSQAAVDAGGRRVMLAYIERSRDGYAVAIDAAVMLTNRDWIPSDSSYEVRAADELARVGRRYIKPLRYDGSAVFPDYILTDENPPAYFEVWGRPGLLDYEQRRREKRRHYRNSGARLHEWTVTEPMPSLAL
ncbi:DUF1173 family protein [Nocardia asiatica]|uniref:DUF1173 family protein n=1 Tax=Nocardia asiatica TaxID=209252 RepID=UPI0012FCA4CA|nr:DUF1173 family protein [Nocardia asiatica]